MVLRLLTALTEPNRKSETGYLLVRTETLSRPSGTVVAAWRVLMLSDLENRLFEVVGDRIVFWLDQEFEECSASSLRFLVQVGPGKQETLEFLELPP